MGVVDVEPVTDVEDDRVAIRFGQRDALGVDAGRLLGQAVGSDDDLAIGDRKCLLAEAVVALEVGFVAVVDVAVGVHLLPVDGVALSVVERPTDREDGANVTRGVAAAVRSDVAVTAQ